MTFLGKLRALDAEAKARAQAEEEKVDPWLEKLTGLKGEINSRGDEQISSEAILNILEISQRERHTGAHRRISNFMKGLGWQSARIVGHDGRQVRGYVRQSPDNNSAPQLPKHRE